MRRVAPRAVGDRAAPGSLRRCRRRSWRPPWRGRSARLGRPRRRRWCRTCRAGGGPDGSGDRPRSPPPRSGARTGPGRPRRRRCPPPRPGSSGPKRVSQACKLGEPGGGRRERLDAEHTAVGVERSSDMDVEVGVDPTGDRARLYDGHRHPFSVQVVKGWHARPGKETVTIGLRQQTDRSPSGTGRAPYPPTADRQTSTSMLDKSDRAAGAADRSGRPGPAGGYKPVSFPRSGGRVGCGDHAAVRRSS